MRKAIPPGTYRRYNGPQPSARPPQMNQWHGVPNGGYQNVPPPGPPMYQNMPPPGPPPRYA
jgi:hypothetical protein